MKVWEIWWADGEAMADEYLARQEGLLAMLREANLSIRDRVIQAIPMCVSCGKYRVGLLRRIWIRITWRLWPEGRVIKHGP